MKTAAPRKQRGATGGFTLIELLLTLVVLLMLLGAIVMNFTELQTGVQVDEGAEQFESLVRYARAQAASTGCRVRLSFEEAVDEDFMIPLGNVFVSWEPEPLERPGEFQPLAELSPLVESLLQLVEVEDVRPLRSGSSNGATQGLDSEEEQTPAWFAPITFYPDGSSDSAEVILSARDSDDERRLAIRIIGATGTVKREVVRSEFETAADEGGPNAN
jgi:prepilin-type N-terminal cleavage/methylation domain-containing protein